MGRSRRELLPTGSAISPRELTYARANGVPGLQLVQGTEPFNADVVGAVIRGLGV